MASKLLAPFPNNPCYFQKQTHTHFKTFSKTSFKTLKYFSKDKHLCIHSYERESLQRLPKRWPLFKILSKPHQAPFQTKQSKTSDLSK